MAKLRHFLLQTLVDGLQVAFVGVGLEQPGWSAAGNGEASPFQK